MTSHMDSKAPPLRYRDFVKLRAQTNPCLSGLVDYLSNAGTRPTVGSSQITLDFPSDGGRPSEPKYVTESDLHGLLHPKSGPAVRILLVEDIQPRLVEFLGAELDIDPLFFAGHIVVDFQKLEEAPAPPSLALFPSHIAERGFLHVHYQQVLDLGLVTGVKSDGLNASSAAYRATGWANVPRYIRRLPPLSGRQLALARRACSVILKKMGDTWICLMLIDPPIQALVDKDGAFEAPMVCRPLNAGYEDFAQPMTFTQFRDGEHKSSGRQSMLKDIVDHLSRHPPSFQDGDPSILCLAKAPIRISLANWMTYTQLTSRYVKFYEYSLQDVHHRIGNSDIIDLQRWRRRIKQSQHKLLLLREFVERWMPEDSDSQSRTWNTAIRDIGFVQSKLTEARHLLEQMIPVATAMSQVLDTRHSILQAYRTTRLTYIALVFVPLSWIASLFSMAEGYAPGQEKFWMYFAVALPLLFFILAASVVLSVKRDVGLLQRVLEGVKYRLPRGSKDTGKFS